MLKQLYIKNYKGFKEELIEIKDVNFLVGENSTGKTSLLKLINIISGYSFWNSNDGALFNNDQIELGYFEEIKNQNIAELFFRIGIETIGQKNNRITRLLFEYENKNQSPILSKLKFNFQDTFNAYTLFNSLNVNCDFDKTKIKAFRDWLFFKKIYTKKYNTKFPDINLSYKLLNIFTLGYSLLYKKDTQISKHLFNDYKYKWLAPIRAKAKRTYESFNTTYSAEGDHVPVLLKNLLNGNKNTKEAKLTIKALEKFGEASNLFDKIEVVNLGQNGTSTFKINILYNGLPMVLPNVGYGVAQALPLLIETLKSKETLISLQQPEVHLHPRAQAAFGDFVYDSYKKDKNRFLIESHSEYMIDRFRQALSKSRSKAKNPTAQVLYFERSKRGNKITAIPINSNGSYEKALPKSYERFFLNEELNTLHL